MSQERVTSESSSGASAESGRAGTSAGSSPAASVREVIRGKGFEAQEAALKPIGGAPVQMRKVYRGMTEAGGKPGLGESARLLGVRVPDDIPVVGGMVEPAPGPKKKGMSTAPDDPKNLPAHRRGPEWGGTGKDPVWETEDASLTNDKIRWFQDGSTHGTVEPAKKMPYGDYKGALEATQGSWSKKNPSGG